MTVARRLLQMLVIVIKLHASTIYWFSLILIVAAERIDNQARPLPLLPIIIMSAAIHVVATLIVYWRLLVHKAVHVEICVLI